MVDGFEKASQGYKEIDNPFLGLGEDCFDVRFSSKKLLVPVKKGDEYTWRIPGIGGRKPEDEACTAENDFVLVVSIENPDQKVELADVMAGSSNVFSMMPANAHSLSSGSGSKDLSLECADNEIEEFFRHYAGDDFDVKDMGTHKEVMVFDPSRRAFVAPENVEWEGLHDSIVHANAGDMVINEGTLTSDLIISAEDLKNGNHRSFVKLDDEGNIPKEEPSNSLSEGP